MPERIGAGSGRWARLLLCCAALFISLTYVRGDVARVLPEERIFSTEPQPRFTTFLYAPRSPVVPDRTAAPVIFYCGEWGWTPLHEETAAWLASTGRFVLGIDAPSYFTRIIPGPLMAGDLEKFRGFVNERAGRPRGAPVILAGFSAGAQILPYLVNRTAIPDLRGLVLIAPGRKGASVMRAGMMLKLESSGPEVFDVDAELRRMPPLPVVFLEGALDDRSQAKALSEAAPGPRRYAAVAGGDHQFHDVRNVFLPLLGEALHWLDGDPSAAPASTPPAAVPLPTPTPGGTPPPGR